jgi:hypothetical protein
MALDVKNLALSALSPVKFTYNFNSNEELNSEYRVVDSGIRYNKQSLLQNCADGAFSQNNAVMLTDLKDIKGIFDKAIEKKTIKDIPCCFYLSVSDTSLLEGDVIVTNTNSSFYVGGNGQQVIFDSIPVTPGVVEIKANTKQLAVADSYPYDLVLLNEPLQENLTRQQFEIEVLNNKITLKNNTPVGYRYLSYGIDRKLRFVGVQLNSTIINEYLFTPVFISSDEVEYNFDPSTKEVRYFNQSSNPTLLNKLIDVKSNVQLDTNLLVSCSLKDVASKNNVGVNIAITKTNFTAAGTFNSSL